MTEFDTNCRMLKKDFQTNDCMLKNSHIYFLCNKKMQKFCNNYWQMWKFCSTILNVSSINADVAELADAQDLKSCGWINRAGSIPAICTNDVSVRTFYRTDGMKINQKWLIFFCCKKSHPILKGKDGAWNEYN